MPAINPERHGDNAELPDAQTLMAAIIRLMAKCVSAPDVARIRTLLALLAQMRGHPQLSREPAVLAGLAEAHATWVDRLGQVAIAGACQGPAGDRGRDGGKVH